jgi:hypothetical protein
MEISIGPILAELFEPANKVSSIYSKQKSMVTDQKALLIQKM